MVQYNIIRRGNYASLLALLMFIFASCSSPEKVPDGLLQIDLSESVLKTGLFGYSFPRITIVTPSGEFASIQFPAYMSEEYNELIKDPPEGFTFETAIAKNLSINDNPIIMLISLK